MTTNREFHEELARGIGGEIVQYTESDGIISYKIAKAIYNAEHKGTDNDFDEYLFSRHNYSIDIKLSGEMLKSEIEHDLVRTRVLYKTGILAKFFDEHLKQTGLSADDLASIGDMLFNTLTLMTPGNNTVALKGAYCLKVPMFYIDCLRMSAQRMILLQGDNYFVNYDDIRINGVSVVFDETVENPHFATIASYN